MYVVSDEESERMKLKIQEGNLFLDTNSIPWTPWIIRGVEFKLLNVDGLRGTMLMRIAKGAKLARHRHDYPVEFFIVEGSFGYADEERQTEHWIDKHGYLYEPPGTVHQPLCPDGCLGLAVFHGPVAAVDEHGNEVMLSMKDYRALAEKNGAAAHLR